MVKMEALIRVEALRSEFIVQLPRESRVNDLFQSVPIPSDDCYVVCNGRIADKDQYVAPGLLYRIVPRLVGGKGGFGSMLRALGAQIEKTTNREACRDLSGRRMRDVNNEKHIKEWIDKKAERERERERKRQEKRERRQKALEGPSHKFDDPEYFKQKMQVAEHLEEALQQGLQKSSQPGPSTSGTSVSRKRKSRGPDSATAAKKTCEWLGIDNISDLDTSSSSDSDDDSAVPGPSSVTSALPDVAPSTSRLHTDTATAATAASTSAAGGDSDSGVESTAAKDSKTPGNSPMDVDSPESSDDGGKVKDEEERMHTEGHQKPDLLASLPPPTHSGENVDLLAFDDVSGLEVLGLEGLKVALTARGMKCGGTLQQRAERLWAARGKEPHEIDPSLLAGKSKGKGKGKKS